MKVVGRVGDILRVRDVGPGRRRNEGEQVSRGCADSPVEFRAGRFENREPQGLKPTSFFHLDAGLKAGSSTKTFLDLRTDWTPALPLRFAAGPSTTLRAGSEGPRFHQNLDSHNAGLKAGSSTRIFLDLRTDWTPALPLRSAAGPSTTLRAGA